MASQDSSDILFYIYIAAIFYIYIAVMRYKWAWLHTGRCGQKFARASARTFFYPPLTQLPPPPPQFQNCVYAPVNGSLISFSNPPPDITTEFISGDSKLTIVGRPKYNGIEVVGVARFFSSSPDESTNPPAILGGIYPIKHSSYILYMQKFYCTKYYIVLQFR